jgi:hypothetical protein
MSSTTIRTGRYERAGSFGHFVFHFFEMCIPMCIGSAVGDATYFAVADRIGSSEPFRDWPELSLAIVTLAMITPMVAWMRFRGLAWQPTAEMAVGMVVLALLILAAGWLGIAAMQTLPWLAHSLMMPAMLIPMVLRLDLYTGHEKGAHR